MPTIDEVRAAFEHGFDTAHEYLKTHADDKGYVDVAGVYRDVAAEAADQKRNVVSEIPESFGVTQGTQYELRQNKRIVRSYSTNTILTDIAKRLPDMSLPQIIHMLLGWDVIEIKWKWTNLRKFLSTHDIPLRLTFREIDDGDPDFHVGEVEKMASPQLKARVLDG